MLDVLDRNRAAIESDVNALTFYMHGGLDYNDAWLLTFEQRKNLFSVVQKHYDAMNPNKQEML